MDGGPNRTNKIKLRFRDGLVWTVGLTVQIKLRFKIAPRRVQGALHNRNVNYMDCKFY